MLPYMSLKYLYVIGIHFGSLVVPEVVAYILGLPGNKMSDSPCMWRLMYGRRSS